MSEQIRKNRNIYMRMWRKKNKEKVKEINKRYYENKVINKRDSPPEYIQIQEKYLNESQS